METKLESKERETVLVSIQVEEGVIRWEEKKIKKIFHDDSAYQKEPHPCFLQLGHVVSCRLHSSSGSAAHVASFLLCLFHLTLSTEKETLLFFFLCV